MLQLSYNYCIKPFKRGHHSRMFKVEFCLFCSIMFYSEYLVQSNGPLEVMASFRPKGAYAVYAF